MIKPTPILAAVAIIEAVIIGILLGSRFQLSLTPTDSTLTKRRTRSRKPVRTMR